LHRYNINAASACADQRFGANMVSYSLNTWNHSAHWGLAPSLPEQIRAASAAGYDHIGLDVPSLRAHEHAGLSCDRIRSLLDQYSLPCYELVPISVTGDRRTVADLDEVVRFARTVGAHDVLAVVGSAIDTATIHNLERVVDTLGAIGVGVSIEFLPTQRLNSIRRVHEVIARLARDNLRMVIDSWHFFAGPSTWADLQSVPVEEIGFVQFSDAGPAVGVDVVDEYRHRRVLPGEGTHDVARFAQTVRRRVPDVTVSVEVLSREWRSAPIDEFATATLNATRTVWENPAPETSEPN
jgi:sugar phosphate isomerase/epimerase